MLTSLSGRFLILAVIFVMIAEVMIFVPSIARFRVDYLTNRMERAQIAALALLGTDEMIDPEVEVELLENAGVLNVVLRRDALRQLVLSSDLPGPVAKTVDLRDADPLVLMRDAMLRFVATEPEVIRVIAEPARGGGMQIEAAIDTGGLHKAMIEYGINILWLSLVISVITSVFLFLAVRRLMVMPIKSLVRQMNRYAEAPEDGRRVIEPRSRVAELREAETTLQSLETQLTQSLRQKERLAQLGRAVAKISHDLRNILTTATLLGDRLEMVDDPTVKRVAPKIVNSLTRAVNLTEGTLAFGRAEEAPPALQYISAGEFLTEVCEAEQLSVPAEEVAITHQADPRLTLRADPEQLHRVVGNLIRNARQAIQATGRTGQISVSAAEDETGWTLHVADTGPGLPKRAQDNLFQAFQGSVRKGGTGLGLAIARELIQGHGGDIALQSTGPEGTVFCVHLPKGGVGDAFA
ncbi:ATPase [Jannaschia pagri]|uniref:histidine kinase n=1 Tax=Jannaschia pagri TaxID=2829797 RepID=A0ABQ4NHH6_9RHOB|nr:MULTISPECIES: HAMP domain-containing sensor histidine kinase [unclassified Jannaschia]GIT90028.1 ATPase [Jannaschia sp. AI_61]GIT93866.1 ATPase [Jannaschia sp. AI_62]